MSELKTTLSRKEQEKIKPAPEDLIPLCLDGDMQKNALYFTAYLRTNKNKLVWFGCNAWKINCKGRPLCGLSANGLDIKNDNRVYNWFIILNLIHLHEYEHLIENEKIKTVIQDSCRICNHCNPKCAGKITKTVFNKEIKGTCRWYHSAAGNIYVGDPDKATVEGISELLELEQRAREEK